MCVRRQSVCAAFALVCTLVYSSAAWGVYDREFVSQEDFSVGAHEGLGFTSELGGLTLSKSIRTVPFVWAPSPRDGMVSKIDARNGLEIARYRIGPASESWTPCAVASDQDGNAYIACAGSNSVGRIAVILAKGNFDHNKDGRTSTSGDYDGNGVINPTEILPWGSDDVVGLLCDVASAGAAPSGIVCDGKGSLWVSLYGECRVVKIDIAGGKQVASVPVVGKPGTLVMGLKDSLWVLSEENSALTEINTSMGTIGKYYNLAGPVGGMCMGSEGKLWIGSLSGGLLCLKTESGEWSAPESGCGLGIAGVTVDPAGDIWGACPASSEVVHFSADDGSILNEIPLGRSSSCVSTDPDGYVWALCDSSDGAIRIDTRTEKAIATAQTAAMPFSSTSFVSKIMDKGFLPKGSWRTVCDSRLEGAGWGKISWSSLDAGGMVKMQVRSADSVENLQAASFKPVGNGMKFGGPNGRYLELVALFDGTGTSTPVLNGIHVEGVNLAPDVSQAEVTVPRIGRMDHVMESVSIMGVKDPEGDSFKVVVTSVTQDEPLLGLGEGDKSPDAMLTGGDSVWLRGECDMGTDEALGKGRTYTVVFKATDTYGDSSTGKVKVTVAPSIKPSFVVVEGDKHYDSTRDILQNVAKAE